MKFGEICENNKILNRDFLDKEILGVCQNDREVKSGDVYFNLSKNYENGLLNSKNALKNGASFVVSQVKLPIENLCLVDDVRETFGECCCNFYGNPSKMMKVIGITGTNGKTTTTHIISEILRHSGNKVATIGTMGVDFDGDNEDYSMTTPDVDILQKEFAKMVKSGVQYVVMEVSAHAIEQKRIYGINFDVAVLTNITQDHLDYFGTMDNYAECKISLFSPKYSKSAVVCADDDYGIKLLEKIQIPTISYGLNNPADVFAVNMQEGISGSKFCCNVLDDVCDIKTNLVGEYNIQNVLGALSACSLLGISLEDAKNALEYISPVEGRFNVVKYKVKNIVIDFAHTPDGLEKVLKTAKDICEGKLFCVFGCGGNRDVDKRHKMGKIAEKYADIVCLTNDNPRFEEPAKIVSDIEKGMKKSHFVELDRKLAIEKMIGLSKEGDIVVIAGKGGEKYQIIGDKKIDYNDFDVVYNLVNNETKKNMVKFKENYGD